MSLCKLRLIVAGNKNDSVASYPAYSMGMHSLTPGFRCGNGSIFFTSFYL